MGWLNKIFSKGKRNPNAVMNLNVSMKGYEPTFTSFGKNILQSDIIYSATKMKARFFGKLEPKHIRVKQGDDKSGHTTELVTDSSVARILRKPNDFQTTYDFLTQAYFMREMQDNCFIYPDYYTSNNGQRIYTGMYVLLPIMTPIVEQDLSGKLFLRFQFVNPAREVVFPFEDIIVWKQNIEDNQFIGGGRYAGLSNVDLLNSLSAYHTSKEAVAEAAKLGCCLDGIIKVNAYAADNKQTQEIRDKFIADLKQNKSGIGVLDNGADYQNIQRSLKMVDAATLAEIKENVMLHVGLTMDMLQGKFTEQEKEAFYENWIEPAAISLGQAMSKVFFSQWQTSYGDQIQLYPRKIQLMSTAEITRVVQSTINAGVFTLDEYREMYGYAPLPNGEGLARPRGFNHLDGENGEQQPQQFITDTNERNLRFNENHNPKDGKFVDGHGHHGHDPKGANAKKSNAEKIADLEKQKEGLSLFDPKRKEINDKIKDLEQKELEKNPPKEQPTQQEMPKQEKPIVDKPKEGNVVTPHKEQQFDIIQKTNAMTDEYHTGIRTPSDIKSPKEAFGNPDFNSDYIYPDFSYEDGKKALETGRVTVYSSKPIKQGGFVSPSKMMAQDYAGSGQVYSLNIDVNDVAWIDSNEGQLAKVK